MFIVKYLGTTQLFLNKKEDDFIQGFANKFGLKLDEIEVEYVSDEDQIKIKRAMLLNPEKFIDFDLVTKEIYCVHKPEAIPGQAYQKEIEVADESGKKEKIMADFHREASDEKCQPKKEVFFKFKTHKVNEFKFEKKKNKVTGKTSLVQTDIVLEETAE